MKSVFARDGNTICIFFTETNILQTSFDKGSKSKAIQTMMLAMITEQNRYG